MIQGTELRDVSFIYPGATRQVLSKISLSFPQRGITAIMGPNGSGKTTLTKLIMGILKPTAGKVFFEGQPIEELTLAKMGRKIGYVMQNPAKQFFSLTVKEEIYFGLKESPLSQIEKEKIVTFYLDYFQLTDYQKVFPLYLSQGEQQRVILAATAVLNPNFFLLDEPTSGLDQKGQALLGKYLKRMAASGKGIIMVSHDTSFVKAYSSRIINLAKEGVIIKDEEKQPGSADEINH